MTIEASIGDLYATVEAHLMEVGQASDRQAQDLKERFQHWLACRGFQPEEVSQAERVAKRHLVLPN